MMQEPEPHESCVCGSSSCRNVYRCMRMLQYPAAAVFLMSCAIGIYKCPAMKGCKHYAHAPSVVPCCGGRYWCFCFLLSYSFLPFQKHHHGYQCSWPTLKTKPKKKKPPQKTAIYGMHGFHSLSL